MSDTPRDVTAVTAVIPEPATWRRPMGVLDAERKRATQALDALCAPRPIRREPDVELHPHPVLDAVLFACLIAVGCAYVGYLELTTAARRLVRRLRPRRRDDLEADVLAQLRANARRLVISKPSTRT